MYIIILLCMFFVGCTTTQYVPVETTKVEYKNTLITDSIHIRDSIFVKEKGDTVFLEKYKIVYRDRLLRDTIMKRDSIPVIHTVETTKEVNKLKNWQTILMVLGGTLIGIIGYRLLRIIKG